MIEIKKSLTYILNIFLFIAFVYYIIFPSLAEENVTFSIKFCLETIVPSLFLYIVLAEYIFPRILNIFGTKYATLTAFIAGNICGFPIGARIAVNMYDNGCEKKYAEYICSFCNNASISFLIGFVGSNILGSPMYGFIIFTNQIISSLICSYVIKYVTFPKSERKIKKIVFPKQNEIGLSKSITNAAKTIYLICACIIFFICLSEAAVYFLKDKIYLSAFIKGFFEFSGAISACRDFSFQSAYVFISAFVGWSGCCVIMQIKTIVGTKLSIKTFVLSKILQAVIMTIFAIITKNMINIF